MQTLPPALHLFPLAGLLWEVLDEQTGLHRSGKAKSRSVGTLTGPLPALTCDTKRNCYNSPMCKPKIRERGS
jgi:hypothetical protein